MSEVTLQIGGTASTTSFTYFTSSGSGTDIVSPIPTRSTATAPVSGAFIDGDFTALRPIRFVDLTIYFTSTSAGSVDLQISTANTGAGGYQSAAISTVDPNTGTAFNGKSVTPNYSSFHNTALWFGFQKNDASTVRGYRDNVSPIRILIDGNNFPLSAGILRGNLTYHTVPNAPTSFTSPSKTTTSVSLSWVKPTDMGGPTSLTGYRILYKTSASSTWTATGDFGGNTTTTYTVSGLVPNTTYNFRVAATNSVTDARNTAYTSPAEHTGTNSAQLNVTTFTGVPTAPTLTFTRSNLVFSYSGGGSTVDFGEILSYEVSQRISSDGGTTFGAWSVIQPNLGGGDSYSSSFTGIPARSYQVRVRAQSEGVYGPYTTSSTLHAPNVPLVPTNPIVLTQNLQKVNVDWDPFTTNANPITAYNGATITGYQVESRDSSDGGATFTSYANIATTASGTTVFLTSNLVFAKTYQFRVRATSNVGNSAYQTSGTILVATTANLWNGSTFVPGVTSIWNGSSWVETIPNTWDGSQWVSGGY